MAHIEKRDGEDVVVYPVVYDRMIRRWLKDVVYGTPQEREQITDWLFGAASFAGLNGHREESIRLFELTDWAREAADRGHIVQPPKWAIAHYGDPRA